VATGIKEASDAEYSRSQDAAEKDSKLCKLYSSVFHSPSTATRLQPDVIFLPLSEKALLLLAALSNEFNMLQGILMHGVYKFNRTNFQEISRRDFKKNPGYVCIASACYVM